MSTISVIPRRQLLYVRGSTELTPIFVLKICIRVFGESPARLHHVRKRNLKKALSVLIFYFFEVIVASLNAIQFKDRSGMKIVP